MDKMSNWEEMVMSPEQRRDIFEGAEQVWREDGRKESYQFNALWEYIAYYETQAQAKHTGRMADFIIALVISLERERIACTLFEEIICPMCYRLNPQHALMDNGEGCHYCQEREDWQALRGKEE